MPYATDRDLLLLDPLVFNEFPATPQQRINVDDATVSGTTLTSVTADFTQAQIDEGHIALLAGRPIEIVARVDANTLTASQLRNSTDDDPIAPGDTTSAELIIRTFGPQIAIAHAFLLDRLNLLATETAAVLNPEVAARLEAMQTIAHVYAWSFNQSSDATAHQQRTSMLAKRFANLTRTMVIQLDRDGDGIMDDQFDFGTATLTRI